MSADSRSITTDALAVLGTIIDETVGRDAIHLAVEPVTAASILRPGERITLVGDGEADFCVDSTALGIVDPFLTKNVLKGERFLMVLLPRQIATLRHVWDHPAFPPSQGGGVDLGVAPAATPLPDAKRWLEDFASRKSVEYGDLVKNLMEWSAYGSEPWWWDYSMEHEYDEVWDKFDDLLGYKIERGAIDMSCRGC